MRNTVVALGELAHVNHSLVNPSVGGAILTPDGREHVAVNLLSGDDPLPVGTPVLVVALPDVDPTTIQRIIRAVQAVKYEAASPATTGAREGGT